MTQPTLYIPHGGGPCFFMDGMGPPGMWDPMAAYLRGIAATLAERPKALLVISAHWEASAPSVTAAPNPALFYDYYGFPAYTYKLAWPAPGAPAVAERVIACLAAAGIAAAGDPARGFDHGVFIPLKLVFPDADIPTVALSLRSGLDPAAHLAIGRALRPLRGEGVLIIGSGMSFHNMKAFNTDASRTNSKAFDAWLDETITSPAAERAARLSNWAAAPMARESHPREEHLIPLMVVAGAAGEDVGRNTFRGEVMGATVSGFQFG